jgi:hypothetical protein
MLMLGEWHTVTSCAFLLFQSSYRNSRNLLLFNLTPNALNHISHAPKRYSIGPGTV